MDLLHALRALETKRNVVISLTGAGGKTAALFQLARNLTRAGQRRVFIGNTTHLGAWQAKEADFHIVERSPAALDIPDNIDGIILVTGIEAQGRLSAISSEALNWLREKSRFDDTPFLLEADGSRQRPFKAPAAHEPPIPQFSDAVIVCAGLSALGKSLDEHHTHRPHIIAQINGATINEQITPQVIVKTLLHPQGGLKNIPQNARRIALLNQADTPALQSIAGGMAKELLHAYDAAVVASLKQESFQTFEKTAGILLAAGESKRYGRPKQLLEWKGKPFVRHIAETALRSALEPVLVVTGSLHAEIKSCLSGLPVELIHNPEFAQGQSTSIRAGVKALPKNAGAALFLLADQPQIPVEVIQALKAEHAKELAPIIAPLVLEERRANPVLFDRITFKDLINLNGDVGGRGIFDKHRIHYLPWHDDILLLDVDKPEDYGRLKEYE